MKYLAIAWAFLIELAARFSYILNRVMEIKKEWMIPSFSKTILLELRSSTCNIFEYFRRFPKVVKTSSFKLLQEMSKTCKLVSCSMSRWGTESSICPNILLVNSQSLTVNLWILFWSGSINLHAKFMLISSIILKQSFNSKRLVLKLNKV